LVGLWERWRNPEAEVVQIFTILAILTTTPNGFCGAIHNRMPVILAREKWRIWLGEAEATADQLLDILRPLPTRRMRLLG
jgi:putative SOS response-associated peptidase YedK